MDLPLLIFLLSQIRASTSFKSNLKRVEIEKIQFQDGAMNLKLTDETILLNGPKVIGFVAIFGKGNCSVCPYTNDAGKSVILTMFIAVILCSSRLYQRIKQHPLL